MIFGVDVTSARTQEPTGIAWVAVNLTRSLWRLGMSVVPLSLLRRGPRPFLPARVRPATVFSLFGLKFDCLLLTDTRDLPVRARTRLAIIHDLISLQEADYAPPAFRRKKQRAYLKICRRADAIITPSEAVAAEVREKLPLPRGGVHAVSWGVDSLFCPGEPDTALLARLGVCSPYLLCVGTLCRRKRQAELVSMFKRLAPSEVQLVLVGRNGYGWEEVDRAAQGAQNILLLGHQNPGVLLHLYRGAAVFVNVSEYEGFCLPVYEAAACGTPVVTTDVADVRRHLGGAGLVVGSVEEAVEAALSLLGGGRCRDVGRRCAEAVRGMVWDAAAARLLEVSRRFLLAAQ